MLWLGTFQMGLIIYVSLLMLTPKILILPLILKTMLSCPGLTPMQHFTISLKAGSMEHSPPHQWTCSHGGHLHFKEILSPSLGIPLTTIIWDVSSSSEDIEQP